MALPIYQLLAKAKKADKLSVLQDGIDAELSRREMMFSAWRSVLVFLKTSPQCVGIARMKTISPLASLETSHLKSKKYTCILRHQCYKNDCHSPDTLVHCFSMFNTLTSRAQQPHHTIITAVPNTP
jgi:hypothetical protein